MRPIDDDKLIILLVDSVAVSQAPWHYQSMIWRWSCVLCDEWSDKLTHHTVAAAAANNK